LKKAKVACGVPGPTTDTIPFVPRSESPSN
jgi:hypothetical protein